MGKAISVKVSKDKLIDALKVKVKEIQSKQDKYERERELKEEAEKNYFATVRAIILKTPELIDEVRHCRWYGSDKNEQTIKFELDAFIPVNLLPPKPEDVEKPFKARGYGRNYVSDNYEDIMAELTNAIRLLEMSEATEVSTATYDNVSRYL